MDITSNDQIATIKVITGIAKDDIQNNTASTAQAPSDVRYREDMRIIKQKYDAMLQNTPCWSDFGVSQENCPHSSFTSDEICLLFISLVIFQGVITPMPIPKSDQIEFAHYISAMNSTVPSLDGTYRADDSSKHGRLVDRSREVRTRTSILDALNLIPWRAAADNDDLNGKTGKQYVKNSIMDFYIDSNILISTTETVIDMERMSFNLFFILSDLRSQYTPSKNNYYDKDFRETARKARISPDILEDYDKSIRHDAPLLMTSDGNYHPIVHEWICGAMMQTAIQTFVFSGDGLKLGDAVKSVQDLVAWDERIINLLLYGTRIFFMTCFHLYSLADALDENTRNEYTPNNAHEYSDAHRNLLYQFKRTSIALDADVNQVLPLKNSTSIINDSDSDSDSDILSRKEATHDTDSGNSSDSDGGGTYKTIPALVLTGDTTRSSSHSSSAHSPRSNQSVTDVGHNTSHIGNKRDIIKHVSKISKSNKYKWGNDTVNDTGDNDSSIDTIGDGENSNDITDIQNDDSESGSSFTADTK